MYIYNGNKTPARQIKKKVLFFLYRQNKTAKKRNNETDKAIPKINLSLSRPPANIVQLAISKKHPKKEEITFSKDAKVTGLYTL